jgi:hypothetical protein
VKVFISWSGEPSRTIARELAEWLKTIVQVTVPWVSDRQIRSGQRWREVIGSALQDTNVGIICLTRTNQHEPWLIFEAGALAKLEHAQVIPLYIDIEGTDVVGPLEDWQGRNLDRDGMWQVVSDINAATTQSIPEDSLRHLFDLTWPQLDAAVEAAKAKYQDAPAPAKRDQDSMLDELVERTRRIERNLPPVSGQFGIPTVYTAGPTDGTKYLPIFKESLRLRPNDRDQYIADELARQGVALPDVMNALQADFRIYEAIRDHLGEAEQASN